MSVIETPKAASSVKRRMRAQFRATPDQGEGKFEALVSAYDLEYSVGWGWTEKIVQGAFADSIKEQNGVVPVMYEHEWGQAPIGDAIASEASVGLIVRGGLYLDTDPFVQRIWQAMTADALREYSIAFFPLSFDFDPDNPMMDIVTRGELIEASVCVRGANPGTETLDLRSSQPVWLDAKTEEREEERDRLATLRKRSFAGTEVRKPEASADQDALDKAIERQVQKACRKLASGVDSGDLTLSSSAVAIIRALVDDEVPDPLAPAIDPAVPVVEPVVEPVEPVVEPTVPAPVPAGGDPDPVSPAVPTVEVPEVVVPAEGDETLLSGADLLSSPWARDLIRKDFASAQPS